MEILKPRHNTRFVYLSAEQRLMELSESPDPFHLLLQVPEATHESAVNTKQTPNNRLADPNYPNEANP